MPILFLSVWFLTLQRKAAALGAKQGPFVRSINTFLMDLHQVGRHRRNEAAKPHVFDP